MILFLRKYLRGSILVLLLIYSCSEMELEHHLKEVNKVNTKIGYNWIVGKVNKFNIVQEYNLKKTIGDTMYFVSFDFIESNKDKKYYLYDLRKAYQSGASMHLMSLLNKDTLYYCTFAYSEYQKYGLAPKLNKMTFISGKYYYLYTYRYLPEAQRTYFELHKDSLIKLKGNNLPDLPELK